MGNTVADLEPPEHHLDSEEEDPEEREELMSLGQQVNNVIHNYPVQIFAKTPNRRNERGELLAPVTTRVMCNASQLPDLFLSCTLFEGSYEKWEESLATLFPTLKEWEELMSKAKKSQGLTHLEVWKQWGQLLSQLDAKSGRLLVHHTRKYINNHWKWLPYITKGHHLWSTGLYQTRSTRLIGDKNFKTGPWIVINPRH
ncbi:hypothetical protein FRC06_002362 [Ceratobasidium sp. 370]|nr:hypothetical protein FRC06_002362 [Ceratobasidium sp. 370]